MNTPDPEVGDHGLEPEAPDGLYRCTAECPHGPVHEAYGCEACHDPDAPYIVRFTTWETAYCKRCARQLRSEGYRLSPRGRTLPDDQIGLFGDADGGNATGEEPEDDNPTARPGRDHRPPIRGGAADRAPVHVVREAGAGACADRGRSGVPPLLRGAGLGRAAGQDMDDLTTSDPGDGGHGASSRADGNRDMRDEPIRERGECTIQSAKAIAQALQASGEVSVQSIRSILDAQYGDYEGGWENGDAHEACELSVTDFLFRHDRAMRKHAKSEDDIDRMIVKLANREPRLRGASQRHDRLQHHGTPLEVAWAMALAACLQERDRILDPGAGTGLLLAMAHLAEPTTVLHGNEGDQRRAGMLRRAAPRVSVYCADALEPDGRYPADWGEHDTVLMNPPFSARMASSKRHLHEGLRHVMAARRATREHGWIVALLSGGTTPRGPAWERIIDGKLRLECAWRLQPALMRNRSASTTAYLCVLVNDEEDDRFDAEHGIESVDDARRLMTAARQWR